MTWLAWRRHQVLLTLTAGGLLLLGLWMALVEHAFATRCTGYACNNLFTGWHSPQAQAATLDLILLVLPCAVGGILGASLVAQELQDHTNRLAWTQGISRTKWLVIKWLVVGLSAVVLVGLMQIVVQWWSQHVVVNFPESSAILGSDRIQPRLYNVTGIVPFAYTLFAFSLGAALGAVTRRVGWAIAGTVIAYGLAAYTMVVGIRPSLASKVFLPVSISNPAGRVPRTAWFIGPGAQFIPGQPHPAGLSADQVREACLSTFRTYNFGSCWQAHHLELGPLYQPASHYWPLQWAEAGIYVGVSALLFVVALVAVRRWRA